VRHLLSLALLITLLPLARAAEPFDLRDGDRVVLIGSTLIEREQRYGYWETLLTTRYPDRNITFRNLGWSGDTVFGEAQGRFGGPAEGFVHRQKHLNALKPTVVLVAFGTNEAFEGEAGLPKFLKGLDTLLETLTPTKARIVLVAPTRQENMGAPLPDPAKQNKNIELYRDELKKVADKRGFAFVDLFDLKTRADLTANGMHYTPYGYWRSAFAVEQGLKLPPQNWRMEVQANGTLIKQEGTKFGEELPKNDSPLRFALIDTVLPASPPPAFTSRRGSEGAKGEGEPSLGRDRLFRVKGLAAGKYVLNVDGKPVATADAREWEAGVNLQHGPEFDQAEKLRALIRDKNQLYFHRWRPQNETYLFGFRKHEQGQNAKEVPEFDPLVEKREAEIAKLRVPTPHTYELVPVK
jgi:lysophospholipase L1-like esterase